jgi:hypothetical protein
MTRPALAGSQCFEMLGSIFLGRGGADFLLAVVAAEPLTVAAESRVQRTRAAQLRRCLDLACEVHRVLRAYVIAPRARSAKSAAAGFSL